jgi:hypothetical protein
MTDTEQIELQLLEIIVPAGTEGRNFSLPTLYNDLVRTNAALGNMAMSLAHDRIIAALVDLLEKRCIRIRHYLPGGESIWRQGSETIELFYRGSFTSTREFPAAFTLMDVLVGKDKRGIFISHNVPEAEFLRAGLGAGYPVFVSSDYHTIQGGKPWFAEIGTAVSTATAVLVIVTPDSVDQRWLNFEAGIGIGCGIPVMPLLMRGFTKERFMPPLNQLQARDLANRDDFDGMIKDFTEVFGYSCSEETAANLFTRLQSVCRELNDSEKRLG